MRLSWLAIVVGAWGCGGGGKERPAEEPVRIALGPCAPAGTPFESGPMPRAEGTTASLGGIVRPGSGSAAGPADPVAVAGSGVGGSGSGRGTAGSTTGSGRGGMRARGEEPPQLKLGTPIVSGDLDKAIIRRYLRRNSPRLQYCYEKQLLAKPTLSGVVTTQFTISPAGPVITVSADGVDPEVAGCVRDVIAKIEFPPPKGGDPVQVGYPLIFSSGTMYGYDASTPQPGPDAASSDRPSGPYEALAAAVEPPLPSRSPPPDAARATAPYDPGANNPLRPHAEALAGCLRKQRKPYGVAVVDLTYAARGEVGAVAHGVDSDTASCIAEVARKANVAGAAARGPAQRCAIAFGTMPIGDLPSIDITASELTWRGKSVADPRRLLDDPSPSFWIAPLHDAMASERRTSAARAEPIALSGPALLRPLDNTPMKIVTRAVTTAQLAGVELLPAAQRDSSWRPLREVELPFPPVPLGSGGHPRDAARPPHTGGAERAAISVLVDDDRLWIGLSATRELDSISRLPGGHDWDELLARLREHKASAPFAGRADLEIAGNDPVPYIEVVRAIDVATAAGFVDWELYEPSVLSAYPSL